MNSIPITTVTDDDAPSVFIESLRRTGFAVIRGHDVETGLIGSSIIPQWRDFFDSPARERWRGQDGAQWGYFERDGRLLPDGVTRTDIKQFFHLGRGRRQPDELTPDTHKLLEQLLDLAKVLVGWIGDASGSAWTAQPPLHDVDQWVSVDRSIQRIQRYRPLVHADTAGTVRALAHKDLNLITLLPAPAVPGLQVLMADGEWIDLPCSSELIVVNTGEMLELATAGEFPATHHRVVVKDPRDAEADRWSFPLFVHPAESARPDAIETAPEFNARRIAEYSKLGWAVVPGGGRQDTSGRPT